MSTINYRAFHSEQKKIYAGLTPRSVLRCGRRFGKTTLLEEAHAHWAALGDPVGWFAPDYKLLLPSYKRILRTLRPIVAHSSRVDGIIELETGGSIEFWTLNNEDAGRSRAYKRVAIDEAGLVKKGLKETWEQSIAPTLLDYGGSAIVAGTPKGISEDNWFYQICTDPKSGWKEFHAPTALNPLLDRGRVASLITEYPALVYQQEYLADFVDWSGTMFFLRESMLVAGQPVECPARCDYVFATIDTAVKSGQDHDATAVTYWARSQHAGHPLIVLDWDIVQIDGSLLEKWLPTVFQNLEALSKKVGARMGSAGAHIEDKVSGTILLQQALRRGWSAHPIDSKLTSVGKDERAISVSGYVHRGMVKLSREAFDKIATFKTQTRNHWMTQIFGFRIGAKDGQADDLLDTMTYGVAIALGNGEGY